jgi:hypothetical protein
VTDGAHHGRLAPCSVIGCPVLSEVDGYRCFPSGPTDLLTHTPWRRNSGRQPMGGDRTSHARRARVCGRWCAPRPPRSVLSDRPLPAPVLTVDGYYALLAYPPTYTHPWATQPRTAADGWRQDHSREAGRMCGAAAHHTAVLLLRPHLSAALYPIDRWPSRLHRVQLMSRQGMGRAAVDEDDRNGSLSRSGWVCGRVGCTRGRLAPKDTPSSSTAPSSCRMAWAPAAYLFYAYPLAMQQRTAADGQW